MVFQLLNKIIGRLLATVCVLLTYAVFYSNLHLLFCLFSAFSHQSGAITAVTPNTYTIAGVSRTVTISCSGGFSGFTIKGASTNPV
jgi:hypothetical protein